MNYLVLTEDFCKANIGYNEGVNFFSYTQTNDGRWVTPKQAKEDLPGLFENTDFETVNLEINDFIPDFTPPASDGVGIVIPETYQWIFPIQISEYKVTLKELPNGTKYIERSCLTWNAFLAEFRKDQNEGYRNTIYNIWVYVNTQAQQINL